MLFCSSKFDLFNEYQNKLFNDLDFLLVQGHTPSYNGKNINNKNNKSNKVSKPHTPEIKNMNVKYKKDILKENLNKGNNKNYKRPSTAPHNNIDIKK